MAGVSVWLGVLVAAMATGDVITDVSDPHKTKADCEAANAGHAAKLESLPVVLGYGMSCVEVTAEPKKVVGVPEKKPMGAARDKTQIDSI